TSFVPAIKTNACLLQIKPFRKPKNGIDLDLYDRFNSILFSSLQKPIEKNLKQCLDITKPNVNHFLEHIFSLSQVNKKFFPFELTFQEISTLCKFYAKIVKENYEIFIDDLHKSENTLKRAFRSTESNEENDPFFF
ncbi:MAG: hypothetical protein MHPSP_000614, partial [Paramarteilia canceri]